MDKKELQKISTRFVKGAHTLCKRGGYITLDGAVFYHNYSGLQFATAHASNRDFFEIMPDGSLTDLPTDAVKEREDLISLISHRGNGKTTVETLRGTPLDGLRMLALDQDLTGAPKKEVAPPNDGNIDLDAMNKKDLVNLFVELDCRYSKRLASKFSAEELKDHIEAANALTGEGYNAEALAGIVLNLDVKHGVISDGSTIEELSRVLSLEDLKAIALYLRDNVELDEDVADKARQVGVEE